jgi:hypothetical protein
MIDATILIYWPLFRAVKLIISINYRSPHYFIRLTLEHSFSSSFRRQGHYFARRHISPIRPMRFDAAKLSIDFTTLI